MSYSKQYERNKQVNAIYNFNTSFMILFIFF